MHLQGLDLNLLIALDALLTECNVTRAAERINISQPGMSAALQKLRLHFSDPLLERFGRSMAPTARARALIEPVREILFQIRRLTDEAQAFDASETRRVLRIGGTTFCHELLAPLVIQFLEKAAPYISVQFEDLMVDTVDRLVGGQIDFVITLSQRMSMEQIDLDCISTAPLFSDRLVLIVAKNNDLVGDTVTLDELCKLPYIETRFGNVIAGVSEQIWRQQPKQPKIRAWMPNFQLALDTVMRTNMAAIVPSRLVGLHANRDHVRILPIPLNLPPLKENLFWHQRNDTDPGFIWFRDMLDRLVRDHVVPQSMT